MKFRNRLVKEIRFEKHQTIGEIVDTYLVWDLEGWSLDISIHSDGIELDEGGITLHLVKIVEREA